MPCHHRIPMVDAISLSIFENLNDIHPIYMIEVGLSMSALMCDS
jgi:hypothetical protein